MVDSQVPTFPDSVTILKGSNGSIVYLVGTSHFSKESQEDVAQVINTVIPDIVVVELCQSRNYILTLDESIIGHVSGMTVGDLKGSIRKLGLIQGVFYELMLKLSASISRDLGGMVPGGEFRRAFVEAKKYDSSIYLGDRPVDITIKRVISMMSWSKCIKFLADLLFAVDNKITKEYVEKLKDNNFLETQMLKATKNYPELEKVMIDERDKFLTYSLQSCAGIVIYETGLKPNLIVTSIKEPQVVVGVVGLGHIAGIKNYWETVTENQVAELIIIPPQSRSSKVIKMVIKISAYGLLLWGVSKIPGVKSLSKMTYNTVTSSRTYEKLMKLL